MTVGDPAQHVIIDEVAKVNGSVCAANASVDPSSVAQLVDSGRCAGGRIEDQCLIGLMVFQGLRCRPHSFNTARRRLLTSSLRQQGFPRPHIFRAIEMIFRSLINRPLLV